MDCVLLALEILLKWAAKEAAESVEQPVTTACNRGEAAFVWVMPSHQVTAESQSGQQGARLLVRSFQKET